MLERYQDGTDIGSVEVDGNTFAVEFNDSQSIRKLNIQLLLLSDSS